MVAVLAQKQSQVRRYVEDKGLPFFILVDEDRDRHEAVRRLAAHQLDAWNIARPAVFVIETSVA